MDDIDGDKQILIPDKESATKQAWVRCYDEEAAEVLEGYKEQRKPNDECVF